MSPILRNSGRSGLRPICVKPQMNSPGYSTPEHVVNDYTLAPARSAQAIVRGVNVPVRARPRKRG